MREIYFLTLLSCMLSASLLAQNIGINEDGSNPDASAILDIKANDKGLLIPRMNSAQRAAIASPAEGLVVYDTTSNTFWYYTSGAWAELGSDDGDWTVSGNNLYKATDGNVGIGTNTPYSILNLSRTDNGMEEVHIRFDALEQATQTGSRFSLSNTGTSTYGGVGNWTGNPISAEVSGGSFFSGPYISDNQRSNRLEITFDGLNGTIPAGSTITGIRIEVRRRAGGPSDIEDWYVGITGAPQNKAQSVSWPTSFQTVFYGGAGDLWGAFSHSINTINNGLFELILQYEKDDEFFGSSSERGYVDFVRAVFYYTAPSGETANVWSVGTYDGDFKIDDSPSVTGAAPFLIDDNGVTELGALRLPAGAGAGEVLTSDALGNATWQVPGDANNTNELQDLSLFGTTLFLSGDASTVDLSALPDAVNDADADPTNEMQDLSLSGTTLSLSGDGTTVDLSALPDAVNDADADPTNEMQDLSLIGTTLSLSGDGTTVDLSALPDAVNDADADPTNEMQDLSLSGTTLSLSGDGTTVDLSALPDAVNDADSNPSNELQTISKSGNVISLSNTGGSITLADDNAFNELQNIAGGIGINGGGNGTTVNLSADVYNGLQVNTNGIGLGGVLNQATQITFGTNNLIYNLSNTGAFNITDGGNELLSLDGGAQPGMIFNEASANNADVRMESAANTHMFFLDGSSNRIGINESAPDAPLHVSYNSGGGVPHLLLEESTATDGTRIYLKNQGVADHWAIYTANHATTASSNFINFFHTMPGFNIMQIRADNRVGVNITGAGLAYAFTMPNASVAGYARARTWSTYSDGRIKKNVRSVNHGLEAVMAMQPRRYDQMDSDIGEDGRLIIDEATGSPSIGFIAQELLEVVPEAVTVPADESVELYGVDYTKLIPVLTKAIQEQQELIETQQDQLEAQQKQLDIQSELLNTLLKD